MQTRRMGVRDGPGKKWQGAFTPQSQPGFQSLEQREVYNFFFFNHDFC